MKIKPCQGLWLVSLDKCLAQIETPAPSQLPKHFAGGIWEPPEATCDLNIIYDSLANSSKELDLFPPIYIYIYLFILQSQFG